MIDVVLAVAATSVGAGLYMWLPDGHRKLGVGFTIFGVLLFAYAFILEMGNSPVPEQRISTFFALVESHAVIATLIGGPTVTLGALAALGLWKRRKRASMPQARPDALAIVSGSIEVRMTPSPDSSRVPFVQFETANRGEREIDAGGRPNKLRFVVPREQLMVESDLPATVWVGEGKLIVKRFTTKGFTLEEHGTQGVTVKVETYFETPLIPHEEIRFDYFPASPLQNGWRVGYLDGRINKNDPMALAEYWKSKRWTMAPDPPTKGSALVDIDAFAMDHNVSPNAALSQRIEFEANYIDNSAMFFVQILLATRDDQQTTTKFIKFVPGRRKPYPTPNWEDLEYTVEIDPPSLGKGWRKITLFLPDETERSWGRDGWYYKELRMIRLRGKLGISPIRLY
jgi:hypothetical protein